MNNEFIGSTFDHRDTEPIASSRVSSKGRLLERSAPRRELTQNYQSQPSIIQSVEVKPLSHRSSDISARKIRKDESRRKVKAKNKHLTKTLKTDDNYSRGMPSHDSHSHTRVTPSFMSNNKTKSTNDTSNNNVHTGSSISSHQNSLTKSHESGWRNIQGTTVPIQSMSPGPTNQRYSKDYNFTSSDLKAQYLTHGAGTKIDTAIDKRVSRKPPMHKKNGKEPEQKSNRLTKKKPSNKGSRLPPLDSVSIIEQILSNQKPNIDPFDLRLPNEESTKFSSKKNGIIAGYAANTNQGIIRNYNEDRVSIILNIVKPKGKENVAKWPKCSFFAIYDGHGGNVCADFLKDNLHQFIVRQE